MGPTGILLVALIGAWVGHNLEYLRVWGAHGFAGVAQRSVHLYVRPLGALLLVAIVVGVQSTARLGRRLERRLTELRHPVSARVSPVPGPGSRAMSFAVPTLVGVVWVLQLVVYLVQENAEAAVAHVPAAGLGALTGVHALAPLVHLAVALALVTGLFLLRRQVTQLAAAVRAVAAGLRARRPALAARPSTSARSWTPVQRWGSQRWCRPPPVAVGSFNLR